MIEFPNSNFWDDLRSRLPWIDPQSQPVRLPQLAVPYVLLGVEMRLYNMQARDCAEVEGLTFTDRVETIPLLQPLLRRFHQSIGRRL